MSHEALARKWRPKQFDEVIGQRGVVDTLRNAIASGRLAQSFIFSGPRGVGKTTTARLLARALNCVTGPTADPCGECDACVEIARGSDIDVLEIDAATHTGVSDIREVIVEPLAMSPMRDRFKIFIIDEVHRLSKQAFDALLKSIEEPPAYVTFMMATTDPQNIPETIKSRSQVFELKAISFGAIRDQLRALMTREQIEIDDAALALVARSAEGSMRDALSALDQVLAFSSDKVTTTDVSGVLGLIGRDVQFDIVETVAREDLASAFTLAGSVVESGFELRVVCRELARLMRDVLVVQIDPTRLVDPEVASEDERPRLQELARRYSREDLMRSFDLLSRSEYEIRQSSQPRHTFEMMLVKWIHLRQLTPMTELIAALEQGRPMPSGAGSQAAPRSSAPVPRPAAPGGPRPSMPPRPSSSSFAPRPAAPAAERPAPAASQPAPPPGAARSAADPKAALLAAIREQNKAFFGIVVAQAQKVDIEGDSIVFTFAAVHKSLKSQLDGKRAWVEQLALASSGRALSVVTRELPPVAAAPAGTPADSKRADLDRRVKDLPTVQAVLDVFGGEMEDIEEIS